MGTTDKLGVKLTCRKCGKKETSSVLDKGSMWSESRWGSLGPFSSFDVEATGGGRQKPKVVAASCKDCGAPATVEKVYGF